MTPEQLNQHLNQPSIRIQVEQLVNSTAQLIFAMKVAVHSESAPKVSDIRRMAKESLQAAPFFPEALGLIKCNVKEEETDGHRT